MEKLAGDLLLGLKFVKLEILSTSFIDFLYDELGELSQDLWVWATFTQFISQHMYMQGLYTGWEWMCP